MYNSREFRKCIIKIRYIHTKQNFKKKNYLKMKRKRCANEGNVDNNNAMKKVMNVNVTIIKVRGHLRQLNVVRLSEIVLSI